MNERKQNKKRWFELGGYLVLCALCILWFWMMKDPTDALGYALIVFYFALPLATLFLSYQIGKDLAWGTYRWLLCLFFGGGFLLTDYMTFLLGNNLANNLAWNHLNAPRFQLLTIGMVLSLIGMGIGRLTKFLTQRKA